MNQLPVVWVWTISFDWMRAFIKYNTWFRILDIVYASKKCGKKRTTVKQNDWRQTRKKRQQQQQQYSYCPEGKSKEKEKISLKCAQQFSNPFHYARLYFSIENRIEPNPKKKILLSRIYNETGEKKNNPKTNHIHIS